MVKKYYLSSVSMITSGLLLLLLIQACAIALGTTKSEMIKAPSSEITPEEFTQIWETSIMLGRSLGYVIKQEDKSRHYLMMEKEAPRHGYRRISVQLGNFSGFGLGVQVFGKNTRGDDDIVTSGVAKDVDQIAARIRAILNK